MALPLPGDAFSRSTNQRPAGPGGVALGYAADIGKINPPGGTSSIAGAHAPARAGYFFLFALPLTGWALVSASVLRIPTVLYGVIPWPHLPILPTLTHKAPVEAFLKHIHAYGAWTLIAIVTGHAGAALRHHFIKQDEVLLRILPRFGRSAPVAASLEDPVS